MVDYVVRYSISVAIVAMVNAAHPVNNASHASNACQAALNVTDEAGDAEYKVCLLHEVYPQGVRMRRDSPKSSVCLYQIIGVFLDYSICVNDDYNEYNQNNDY